MHYNTKPTSIIVLGLLSSIAFALPVTNDAKVLDKRALLSPAQLASLASIEAATAAAVASQLAAETAAILKLVG